MSETPKKRTPKPKAVIAQEMSEKVFDKGVEAFKADLQAAEQKHGYRLEPTLFISKMGIFPQIEVQKIEKTQEKGQS